MSLKCGIVGLPNVGKSCLFNCLTSADVPSENYPFCTIDPNVGIVEVPDDRLRKLSDLVSTKSSVPAVVEFVDIAGLVRGASKGEGLGNQFLSHIREVDAIMHVIRCFEDDQVLHVDGSVNAMRDAETIEGELILSDLSVLEKAKDRVAKMAKSGNKDAKETIDVIHKAIALFNELKPARTLNEDDKLLLKEYQLLSIKPVFYLLNVDEAFYSQPNNNTMVSEFQNANVSFLTVCAKLEQDLVSLDSDEQTMMLEEFGLNEPGLDRVIRYVYSMLGLMTFFTAGEKEVRAWTIKKGYTADMAAGVIHTDFEKGFIRAETIHYNDFVEHGGWSPCKNAGLMESNGKTYVVQDGDVMNFLFNV